MMSLSLQMFDLLDVSLLAAAMVLKCSVLFSLCFHLNSTDLVAQQTVLLLKHVYDCLVFLRKRRQAGRQELGRKIVGGQLAYSLQI